MSQSLNHALEHPYDTVRRWFYTGMIDELTWNMYQFYWRNGETRFSDLALQFQIKGTARWGPLKEIE